MTKLKIVFQNLYQGMHYAGENEKGTDIFYKYQPSAYIEYYRDHAADIMCLAEVPLDTKDGKSGFLDKLSSELGLPYYEVYVNDESWVVEGKYYGTAIVSKHPFTKYESFDLPNPKLEMDQPDGSHWVMHDKGAQKATISIDDHVVNIYNLHYFPFGHFGRSMDEEEFHPIRQKLADMVRPKESEVAIVSGDFNNRGLEIENAFPELFEGEMLKRSINFKDFEESRQLHEDKTQIDHILYSQGAELKDGHPECNYSDHCGITAEFEIK